MMGKLAEDPRKQKLSELIFEFEAAVRRCWQVFSSKTRDIGTDYMIGKEWAKLQVQLRSSWIRDDGRYSFQLSEFEKDPASFFAYLLIHYESDCDLDTTLTGWPSGKYDFYMIPTTDLEEIKPFKQAFKSGSWEKKKRYNSTLAPEQIEEFLEKYKNEKGWQLLEKCTQKPD
jgi:hypothetical protein